MCVRRPDHDDRKHAQAKHKRDSRPRRAFSPSRRPAHSLRSTRRRPRALITPRRNVFVEACQVVSSASWRRPHKRNAPIVRRGNAAPDLSDARQARPAADRPWLVLRGEMGRLPRPRLHRRRAEGAEPARLEHDRGAARARGLPKGLVLDGELVAFNKAGDPHFPLLSKRILNRDTSVPVQFMVFDVLAVDGESITAWSYAKRATGSSSLGSTGLPG